MAHHHDTYDDVTEIHGRRSRIENEVKIKKGAKEGGKIKQRGLTSYA
jgi:hypothetical protein